MNETVIYDPFDPEVLTNPYPLYARLREETPVFWNDRMRSWVATRYDDCRDVLRDHRTFARDRRRVNVDVPEFAQNLQTLDPPQLAPLRSLLMNAFRAQDLDAAAHRTHDRIRGLLRSLSEHGEFDWIHEVAAPVALGLTAELFGVTEPDHEPYVAMADAISRRMDAGLDPTVVEPGDEARKRLNALADGWFAQDPGRPGLMTTIQELMAGSGVPGHYIGNSIATIFNASYGTVFAAAGNTVLTLLEHPGALDQFRDPRIVDLGVEELIRFDGPAQGTSRVAAERTVLGGHVIEAGQPVITLLAAANRDPAQFEQPDELLLDRTPNRHLGFGWGSHACLGATFGHVAVREIVLCLLEAPSLRLAGTPVRRRTATVRSMDLLPVSFRK
ncbi:cytochrome P450 [Streptomyces syringium]|uniref:cytochrome P450 n=1 Tax=Streptomyces syringium TaxID=76729 RepID=UPI00341538BF